MLDVAAAVQDVLEQAAVLQVRCCLGAVACAGARRAGDALNARPARNSRDLKPGRRRNATSAPPAHDCRRGSLMRDAWLRDHALREAFDHGEGVPDLKASMHTQKA
jgi:hypothetical protein